MKASLMAVVGMILLLNGMVFAWIGTEPGEGRYLKVAIVSVIASLIAIILAPKDK